MILVTGASGFLGQHLVSFLSTKELKVKALYNKNKPDASLLQLPGIDWVQCDLLDIFSIEEVMNGITEIYHCAAIVSFDPNEREKMLHFNTESTANIVNSALLQGISKMVYISSIAAIGTSGEVNKVITEEEEWGESKYNSAYGLSKYLAETQVWRGIGEGLNAIIVNPGIILGKGNWKSGSPQLISVVFNEFPFYTKGTTAWVDVEDVVNAVFQLMNSSAHTERYILSAGNFSFRDVFTMMAKALNKKPPKIEANKLMTGIAWRYSMLRSRLSGTNPIITRETANNAHEITEYSNKKFLKAFPDFRYKELEITIQNMANSFLSSI